MSSGWKYLRNKTEVSNHNALERGIPVLAEQNNNSIHTPPKPKPLGTKAAVILVAGFILLVTGIVGYPYYQTYLAPWYEPVLEVREKVYNMRDFIKILRLHSAGAQQKPGVDNTMQVLQLIQNKELIRQEAIKRGIDVTKEEVDKEVKRRVMGAASGEGSFEELHETTLRGLRLSAKDYFELAKLDLYRAKLLYSIRQEQPKTAEHIRVAVIVSSSAEKSEQIRQRLQKGEDFHELAKTESIDLTSSKNGGDLGWIPRNVHKLQATPMVHAYGILLKTEQEAEAVREKLEAGEDLTALAREVSQDDETRSRGGYLGWVSTEIQKGKQFASLAYNLEPGTLSEPLDTAEGFWVLKILDKSPGGVVIDDIVFQMNDGQITKPLDTSARYYLVKVTGRKSHHKLTDENLLILSDKALNDWLLDQAKKGSNDGWLKWHWGSEPMAWALDHL